MKQELGGSEHVHEIQSCFDGDVLRSFFISRGSIPLQKFLFSYLLYKRPEYFGLIQTSLKVTDTLLANAIQEFQSNSYLKAMGVSMPIGLGASFDFSESKKQVTLDEIANIRSAIEAVAQRGESIELYRSGDAKVRVVYKVLSELQERFFDIQSVAQIFSERGIAYTQLLEQILIMLIQRDYSFYFRDEMHTRSQYSHVVRFVLTATPISTVQSGFHTLFKDLQDRTRDPSFLANTLMTVRKNPEDAHEPAKSLRPVDAINSIIDEHNRLHPGSNVEHL